jgi:hypothetical protein
MGKKPQRHSWKDAKKLCRLNQNDIEMAKRLGFGPDGLIRSRPDPKQSWKLPVKHWVRDLYFERFGEVLGEKPLVAPEPAVFEYDEDAVRLYGEQLYWEDYRERNKEESDPRKRASAREPTPAEKPDSPSAPSFVYPITEEDVPF